VNSNDVSQPDIFMRCEVWPTYIFGHSVQVKAVFSKNSQWGNNYLSKGIPSQQRNRHYGFVRVICHEVLIRIKAVTSRTAVACGADRTELSLGRCPIGGSRRV